MSYDAWLEAPYQRLYDLPERDDLAELLGEVMDGLEVVGFEVDTDEDEDGQYDVVMLELSDGTYRGASDVLGALREQREHS
jgi:hypothetical protein